MNRGYLNNLLLKSRGKGNTLPVNIGPSNYDSKEIKEEII